MKDPHKRRRVKRVPKQTDKTEAEFIWRPFPHSWTPQKAAKEERRILKLYPELVKEAKAAAEAFGPVFARLEAAKNPVLEEMPWVPDDPKQQMYLLFTFSTCPRPKGLGLSKDQFWGMDYREWLTHYGDWKRTYKSERTTKPKGKPGAPIKAATTAIIYSFKRSGAPQHPIKAKVLRDIAQRAGLLNGIGRGSDEERKVRERVRQAIRRSQKQTAT